MAKFVGGEGSGGKRVQLSEQLPLDTPFALHVFPVYACNFKCSYCTYSSVKNDGEGAITSRKFLDTGLFERSITSVKNFPEKIKVMKIAGLGEPLLHKDISKIVQLAYETNQFEAIEIITNASLLTEKLSEELVESGLKKLTVSIQGSSEERYKEICSVQAFQKVVNNLKYFYSIKSGIDVRIKIIDCAIKNASEEKMFFDIFGEICDYLAIEHVVPIASGVDFKKFFIDGQTEYTANGTPIVGEKLCCPLPFYMLQIKPNGDVIPCCNPEIPGIMGNIEVKSLYDIWNGEEFNHFRYAMLSNKEMDYCRNCASRKYITFPEDKIKEADIQRLKKHYQEQGVQYGYNL